MSGLLFVALALGGAGSLLLRSFLLWAWQKRLGEGAIETVTQDEGLTRSLAQPEAPEHRLGAYRTPAEMSGAASAPDPFRSELERLVRLVKALPRERPNTGPFLSIERTAKGYKLQPIGTDVATVENADLAFGVTMLLEVFDQAAKKRLDAAEREAAAEKQRVDDALQKRRSELRGTDS